MSPRLICGVFSSGKIVYVEWLSETSACKSPFKASILWATISLAVLTLKKCHFSWIALPSPAYFAVLSVSIGCCPKCVREGFTIRANRCTLAVVETVQRQTATTAYFTSEQLPLLAFASRYGDGGEVAAWLGHQYLLWRPSGHQRPRSFLAVLRVH